MKMYVSHPTLSPITTMPDKTITCAEAGCGETFVHTEKSQEFFKERGFSEPRYCKTHSAARKALRETRKNSPFKPAYDQIKNNKQPHTRHGSGGKGRYRGLGDEEMYGN